MLKVRVIPTLLWKQFGLVKGVGFNSWRRVGPVLPAMKIYSQRDVDELILVDILANSGLDGPDFDSISDFSNFCFVPFTVGGGIFQFSHAGRVFRSGADKVAINSAAYENPGLISEIASVYGVQSIVASVDVRKNGRGWTCYSHSGKVNTERGVIEWVRELESLGAGEILLTSIDNDGTMNGYDIRLIEAVATAVNIPVIASGGAGLYQHMADAVIKGGASAVAAASMFHFTEQTPAGARDFLAAAGVPVRQSLLT